MTWVRATRRQASLKQPPGDLDGFPRVTFGPGTEHFRVVRKDLGPWWFNSSGAGRFDLVEPSGTCYLASDELSALLEVIGPDRSAGMVSHEFLAGRRLRKLRLPEAHDLADLTDRQAAGFGVTLEIGVTPKYGLTRAWAAALAQAAYQGLVYFARYDPAAGRSVGLFGPAGERGDWDPGSEHDLDDPGFLERLWRECRIRVAARPRKNELTIDG